MIHATKQLTIKDFISDHGRMCIRFADRKERLQQMIRYINGFYSYMRSQCEEELLKWYSSEEIKSANKIVEGE